MKIINIYYNKVKVSMKMKRLLMFVIFFTLHSSLFTISAQDKIVHPDISYAGTPRTCTIGGLAVEGVEGYEDYVLTGLSGLQVGQQIEVPGNEITEAVKRYWRHGLFSRAQISADSIVGSKIYLRITLAMRPRVSSINYIGIKKSERDGNLYSWAAGGSRLYSVRPQKNRKDNADSSGNRCHETGRL